MLLRSLTLLVLSNPAAKVLGLLEQLPETTDIIIGETPEAFTSVAADADVILVRSPSRELARSVWAMSPRVRWVHSLSASVAHLLFPEFIAGKAPLTNARGVYSRSLAEFVIAAAVFFAKDFRRLLRNQAAGRWEPFDSEELYGKTLGIVGYGSIGRAVAEKARAFGMKIVAVHRRPELPSPGEPGTRLLPVSRLGELLAVSDFVVVATPLTAETRGLIGEAELRMMKRSAVIMNVSRGPVIKETALVNALEQKRIRGAALDVFDTEPLPPNHPFYRLENVLLSPHSADHVAGWEESSMQLFLDNFERFRRGEPLLNVVDRERGY